MALAKATYLSSVSAASFELATDIAGVSVASVSSVSSGDASATLTLAFGGNFGGIETLAVKVLNAADSASSDLTTGTVDVTASAGVTLSRRSLALQEAPGANNANVGMYTMVLDSPPTGCTGVTVRGGSSA